MEEHVSHNLTDALWLSADAYYNVGGETSIDGISQDNMANTLRVGAGMGYAFGAVPTSCSIMSAWSPSLPESRMRRPYASPSGSCGEAKVISSTRVLIERGPKITVNVRKPMSGERKVEQKIMERRTVLKGGVAAVQL